MRRVVAVVAALLLPLVAASAARADITRAQAIRAAQDAPSAKAIVLAHPDAHFQATRGLEAWTVELVDSNSLAGPLARWRIDARGGAVLSGGPLIQEPPKVRLDEKTVLAVARKRPKVAAWLKLYKGVTTAVDAPADGNGSWTVHFYAPNPLTKGDRDEIAQVVIQDSTGAVTQAWTGPQVAWKMARGYGGAFGRKINDPWIWLGLCAVFLVGLVDWRRPLALRNLDLLVLLSFSISLAYFNQGKIFWSVPLQYPPLLYLLVRLTLIGLRGRRQPAFAGRLPLWVLAGIAVFLIGFRGGLNAYNSNVIDVGYAGVIGADRLVRGELPYGNFPGRTGAGCGVKYADGSFVAYHQEDDLGRCESPNEAGDTYGPINYAAYVPALAVVGWTGQWDDLPSAHATSVIFDALCAIGLVLAGRRLGGWRLGAALGFAWAAYPFTAYALQSNSNDMIVAAFLIWAYVALTAPAGRGFFLSLASWTKFAPLLLYPLWLRYPRARPATGAVEWPYDAPETAPPPPRSERVRAARVWLRELFDRRGRRFIAGALAGTLFAGLLLVGGGWGALSTFWDRTFRWQLSRPSPFSIWDWGERGFWGTYRPDFPDLTWLQSLLKVLLVVGAVLLLFFPRRLDARRLAALTGALLIGFELVLSHWFYLYIPWFFPFAMLALLAPSHEV